MLNRQVHSLWLSGILLLAGALVYLNSFPGAFHFDDYVLLLDHPRVNAPDFAYSAFLDHYGGRPLTLWSFHWNYRFFGQDPFSYHLINVLLHLLVVVELFLLVSSLTEWRSLGFGSALLFAVHPLQTQAVNYIWSRAVLLMAVFGLAALLLIRRHPWKALICFQLAVWSRTEAVVLVIPLMLLKRRFGNWTLGVALANVVAFVYSLQAYSPWEVAWNHPDLAGYWIKVPAAFWTYLRLMVWPQGLTVDHHFSSPALFWNGVAGAWLVLLLWVAFRFRRRFPVPCFATLWMVLLMAPSLVMPNSDLVSESRVYLALAGFSVLLNWTVLALTEAAPRLLTLALGGLLLLLLVPVTLSRNALWNDDLALWQDAVKKSPNKVRPHYNLGVALAREGQVEVAEIHFQRAVLLDPEYGFAHAALGYCAELRHDLETALRRYQKALRLNSENSYAREGLERVERTVGNRSGAREPGAASTPAMVPAGELPR